MIATRLLRLLENFTKTRSVFQLLRQMQFWKISSFTNFEVQLQAKITNFTIQINDRRLLGKITDIRLKQLQTREWLSRSPLVTWPYNSVQKNLYRSFIAGLLSLCNQQQINFNVTKEQFNVILG